MKVRRSGHYPYLNAIACASTSFCVAVGGHSNGVGVAALILRWNGSHWKRLSVPVPRGLTSIPIYRRYDLAGVACRTSSDCTAVGAFQAGQAAFARPLVYHWNGSRWRQQSALTRRFLTRLDAVSCPTASSCLAVGQYYTNKIGRYAHAFAESWNGRRWRAEYPPTIAGHNNTDLTGVSCTAAGDCEAVGGDYTMDALVARWNGGKWTTQPTPPKAQQFQSLMLNGVFCASASSCVAVGFPGGLDSGNGVISRWDGTQWTNEPLPTPTVLQTIALGCFDVTTCEVVGTRTHGQRSLVPVAYGQATQ